jgi:hypothetical protein
LHRNAECSYTRFDRVINYIITLKPDYEKLFLNKSALQLYLHADIAMIYLPYDDEFG